MPKIVNLTQHSIVVQTQQGGLVAIPPSGTVARVLEERLESPAALPKLVFLDDAGTCVQFHQIRDCDIVGLPLPSPGTTLITSRLVAEAAQRSDVMFPYDFVRDADGHILACKAFGSALPPKRGIGERITREQ